MSVIRKIIPLMIIAMAIVLIVVEYTYSEGEGSTQINGSVSIETVVENVDSIANGKDSLAEINIHSVIMYPNGGQIGGDITISGKAGTISCLAEDFGDMVKINIGSVIMGVGKE